jgi:predicted nucleic acid-binding protein
MRLGQQCRASGVQPSAMDLLIATIAIANNAELVSLNGDFVKLAKAGEFQFEHVRLLGMS